MRNNTKGRSRAVTSRELCLGGFEIEVEQNQKGQQKEASVAVGQGGQEHSFCSWEALSGFSKILQPYILTSSIPTVTIAVGSRAASYFFYTLGSFGGNHISSSLEAMGFLFLGIHLLLETRYSQYIETQRHRQ